jgi:hypothetical protein
VLLAIGALILVLRRPEDLLAAQFVYEEGNAFYAPTFFHSLPELLLTAWGGYLQAVPRLGYALVAWVPVSLAPLVDNMLGIAMPLAVAGYMASARMASVVPDRRARLAVAAVLLLLPAQRGVLGTFINSQWYLALWMVCVALVADRRCWELAGLALAGLSGPFSIFLAPLYWWRRAGWAAIVVTVCAAVQLGVVLLTGREPGAHPSLVAALGTFGLHGILIPLLGERLTAVLMAWSESVMVLSTIVVGVSVVIVAVRSLPRSILLPAGYSAVVVAVAGIAAHQGVIWDVTANARYFLLLGLLVCAVIIAGVSRHDPLAVLLATLLLIGIAVDFRLTPYPSTSWALHVNCIGSERPCTVPVYPPEYSIQWPGRSGFYVMPAHYDP